MYPYSYSIFSFYYISNFDSSHASISSHAFHTLAILAILAILDSYKRIPP